MRQELGLVEGGEGLVVVSLTALDLGDADLRLDVMGIGSDELLIERKRCGKLAVGEESAGEGALRVEGSPAHLRAMRGRQQRRASGFFSWS